MDQARLYVIAGGAFLVAAISNFLTGDFSLGAACTALGTIFIAIGPSRRRSLQPAAPLELPAARQREVQALVDGGREVEAVKRVREETGAGLLEAKRYVDRLKSSRLP